MAGSLNKVTLIGNIGKDPEVRVTQEGKEIVTFPVATTETWRDKNTGERREKTEWHRVVVFIHALVNIVKNYVTKLKVHYRQENGMIKVALKSIQQK